MIQQSYSWAHLQRKPCFEKVRAPYVHSSTVHNRQDTENTWMSHWQMNGWSRCGPDVQWNITRPQREGLKRCGASQEVLVVENPRDNAGDGSLIPGSGRSPGGGHGNPPQFSGLENPHGQRSLADYSPWGRKQLDTTEATQRAIHTATWMDLEMVILSEVSGTKTMIVWISERTQVSLFMKQKEAHRLWKRIYGYQRGKVEGGGINREFGININILLYVK